MLHVGAVDRPQPADHLAVFRLAHLERPVGAPDHDHRRSVPRHHRHGGHPPHRVQGLLDQAAVGRVPHPPHVPRLVPAQQAVVRRVQRGAALRHAALPAVLVRHQPGVGAEPEQPGPEVDEGGDGRAVRPAGRTEGPAGGQRPLPYGSVVVPRREPSRTVRGQGEGRDPRRPVRDRAARPAPPGARVPADEPPRVGAGDDHVPVPDASGGQRGDDAGDGELLFGDGQSVTQDEHPDPASVLSGGDEVAAVGGGSDGGAADHRELPGARVEHPPAPQLVRAQGVPAADLVVLADTDEGGSAGRSADLPEGQHAPVVGGDPGGVRRVGGGPEPHDAVRAADADRGARPAHRVGRVPQLLAADPVPGEEVVELEPAGPALDRHAGDRSEVEGGHPDPSARVDPQRQADRTAAVEVDPVQLPVGGHRGDDPLPPDAVHRGRNGDVRAGQERAKGLTAGERGEAYGAVLAGGHHEPLRMAGHQVDGDDRAVVAGAHHGAGRPVVGPVQDDPAVLAAQQYGPRGSPDGAAHAVTRAPTSAGRRVAERAALRQCARSSHSRIWNSKSERRCPRVSGG